MTEQSPDMIDIGITIGGRIEANRLPELIKVMQQLSVVSLVLNATANGEQLLVSEPEDPSTVTLGRFRNHYLQNLGFDERPSSLPTRVFNEVAGMLEPDVVSRTKDGVAFAIKRDAFEELLAHRGLKGPITGEKARRLLFGVARDLPPKKI